MTGGRVTHAALLTFRPHVRIEGVGSPFQESLRAVAGSGFYLAIYLVGAMFSPGVRGYWRDVRDAASWFAAVELLGWTLSSLFGAAVTGPNDADQFIAVSGASRVLVAFGAIGLGAAGAGLLSLASRNRLRRIARPQTAAALAASAAGGN